MLLVNLVCLTIYCELVVLAHGANFTQCAERVRDLLAKSNNGTIDPNGTIFSDEFPDPIYHGVIRGFNPKKADRPLTITVSGCVDVCGSDPETVDVINAFSILTTWVLPLIALLTQLPYESLAERKRKNLEAFGNWIGSPAAALTTTIWNISMIQKCRIMIEMSEDPYMQSSLRNSLYVLSCINQYQYPRNMRTRDADERRDVALLRGVLAPYVKEDDTTFTPALREKIENLTVHLAFQLRLYRRKGVYPLWFNLIWFLLAFIFSIVIAFAQLGDNTTAHSLALGLLLSWMPVMVLATIIDRSPVASTRCGILIERWLYNVDALFADEETAVHSRTSSMIPDIDQYPQPPFLAYTQSSTSSADERDDDQIELLSSSQRDVSIRKQMRRKPVARQYPLPLLTQSITDHGQWRKGVKTTDFGIGEYVGQGRRLRYCAVTDTVLDFIRNPKTPHLPLSNEIDAKKFRARLTSRPYAWYVVWLMSQVLVAIAFSTAFVVSFKTPTEGLGCRTLGYIIWYFTSVFSWIFLGMFQEPPPYVRYASWIPNAISAVSLFAIMLLQTTGGLNTCLCKSSTFGSRAFGGYMDFENAQFYHQAYKVQQVWGVATGCGIGSCGFALVWFWRRWSHDSGLWRVTESTSYKAVDGVDLDWLT